LAPFAPFAIIASNTIFTYYSAASRSAGQRSRTVARPVPAFAKAKRTYATEAYVKSSKVKVTFATPYEVLQEGEVDQVILPAIDGYLTATPNSAQSLTQLQPGLVRIKGAGKDDKYFVSGGMALITKDSEVKITAGEACLWDDLDFDAVKAIQSKSQSQMTSGSEAERAIARIQYETASAVLRVVSMANK